jgi:hypothetical protein
MIAGFIFANVGYHRDLDSSGVKWPAWEDIEAG